MLKEKEEKVLAIAIAIIMAIVITVIIANAFFPSNPLAAFLTGAILGIPTAVVVVKVWYS